ncbi:MAG: hypothetical protein QXU32_08410 [Nitrososphaerales archaeon]
MSENDAGKVERELKGKTLQVYIYLLKKKEPAGVREVQRDLNFSSPSVANYHLEKLMGLNLANQDEYGRYYLSQKAQVSVLESFVNVGGRTIPRMSFFAAFFTTLLLAYSVLNINSINIQALGFAAAGAAAFWFETVRVWRRRLF